MIDHKFKPYAAHPDLCVAELDDGETCNEYRFCHNTALDESIEEAAAALTDFRELVDSYYEDLEDGEDLSDEDSTYLTEDKADRSDALAGAIEALLKALEGRDK